VKRRREVWRAVGGYEGIYSVSSLGRVRRDAPGSGTRVGYVLVQSVGSNGYAHVRLCRDKEATTKHVHALVADAWYGPPPPDREVDHRNGDRTDNRLVNLERVTPAENKRRALARRGRRVQGRGLARPAGRHRGGTRQRRSRRGQTRTE
jgi:hypothetical protein